MNFEVITGNVPLRAGAYLIVDNWDDFHFKITYFLWIVDENQKPHSIGSVKIGFRGMRSHTTTQSKLPPKFSQLGPDWFSLGQEPSYFGKLTKLGVATRESVLTSLRDAAFNLKLFEVIEDEPVTRNSLLRNVDPKSVRSQLARMAHGGPLHVSFRAAFNRVNWNGNRLALAFDVKPETQPPSNLHALIGRNGVGKSTLLQQMSKVALDVSVENCSFEVTSTFAASSHLDDVTFHNVVLVSFSAFDDFDTSLQRVTYVGLKTSGETKSPGDLGSEFVKALGRCQVGERKANWLAAVAALSTDPLLEEINFNLLLDSHMDEDDYALHLFQSLSSGHKIVLLTLTQLVGTVAEKTLVLIDEPEAHLPPPLLASLIRAISNLLTTSNAVAIVATHSPVVLQEIPRDCVWMIERFGDEVVATRPNLNTFGENVGVLTSEVFGLESKNSGFNQLLLKEINTGGSFETIVELFGGALGSEALALLRVELSVRNRSR